MSDAENELIETLKNIQDGHAALQFASEQHQFYMENDIIDLTAIPPPVTPDADAAIKGFPLPTGVLCDSNRVVADLDHLCDTLSDMQVTVNPPPPITSEYQSALEMLPTNIDDFIASLALPPPPPQAPPRTPYATRKRRPDGTLPHMADEEEDIYASLIIPPPPSTSMSIEQDDVIAKFWQATDDVKKMCVPEPPPPPMNPPPITVNGNLQSQLHISTTVIENNRPEMAGNTRDSSPRTGLHIREVHSSSSGDSGYDSIMSTGEWPPVSGSSDHNGVSNCSFKFTQLPTVDEGSYDCEARTPNGEAPESPRDVPPSPSGKPPRPPKPPLPPGSPSIIERRKQIANRKASGLPIGPKSQGKHNHLPKSSVTIEELTSHALDQNGYDSFEMYAQNVELPDDHASNKHVHVVESNGIVMTRSENECQQIVRNDLDELFIQSQRDIDILLARLEEAHETKLNNYASNYNQVIDQEKFVAARDALVDEARHFVTASKLFVKCATESAPQVLDHLIECVALLERMYNIGELIVVSLVESQAQVTCLVDRLKEVAATYAYTVDTVHKLTDPNSSDASDPSSSPYMGLLMSHATSLATALSALMRTLRAIS